MTRLVLKTLVYRLYSSGLTALVAFVVTGAVAVAGVIGLAEFFLKGLGYYVFERVWEWRQGVPRRNWGVSMEPK